jgi:hypothetical protein
MSRAHALRWLLVPLLLACALGVRIGVLDREESPGIATASPSDTTVRSASSEAVRTLLPSTLDGAAATNASTAPAAAALPDAPLLPPLDARVADHFDELQSRARRGEVEAACRLGYDLMLCREIPELERSVAFFIDSAARGNEAMRAGTAELIRRIESRLSRARSICEGATPEQLRSAWRYMALAAELGHADAGAAFAVDPPMDRDNFLAELDAWIYYRDNAARLLRQAAANGSYSAIYFIQGDYAGRRPGAERPPAVQADPLMAVAYAMVLERVGDNDTASARGDEIAEMTRTWTPAQFARAEAIAEDVLARHPPPVEPIPFSEQALGPHDASSCE